VRRLALVALAGYYTASGAWPLVSMRSFEAVTGPKVDRWLVKTVGLLAIADGLALGVGARRERPAPETIALAAAAALAFTTVDVVYVLRGRIRPIYLADAAVELALAAAIAFGD
jgi:hypothetical protein